MKDFFVGLDERPTTATAACGTIVRRGDHVRVVPRTAADAFDMLLRGKTAVVESVEQDFEGRTMLAVSFCDDPGRDLGAAGRPGHRFFFHPDEVEYLAPTDAATGGSSKQSIPKPILVAGLGNIFLGDDGFGVEVVRRLNQESFDEHVRVVDFGIRGLDLAFALQEDIAAAIIIDVVQRGQAPGTLYVLEPTPAVDESAPTLLQGHGSTPDEVLSWLRARDIAIPPVRIVGCEPVSLDAPDQGEFILSPPVADAVIRAVQIVRRLVAEFAVSG